VELLIAFPVLILAFIFQTTIIARLTLLNGTADLIMLVLIAWGLQEETKNTWMWAILGGLAIGFGSAVPWFIFPLCYLALTAITARFRSRIWQSPILAMMIITTLGTVLILGMEFVFLRLSGINLSFKLSLTRTILPSMLLNLLLAFPVYWVMREIARLIYRNKNTS
jgi:hypothetical protein